VHRVIDAISVQWQRVFVAIAILAANILLLPVPYLGLEVHPYTHQVTHVEPGSSADRAGVRVGDEVLRLYDRPITDVFTSVTMIGWIPPRGQPVPLVVERNGQDLAFELAQDSPVLESRLFILAMAGLGIVCWVTGYVLGVGRSQSILESHTAAYFWISIGGVLGCLPFALAVSIPLLAVLSWLVAGIFVPLFIAMHLSFPPRYGADRPHPRATWSIASIALLVNSVLITWVVPTQATMIDLLVVLLAALPIALACGFGGSAVILGRAYRKTTVAHTRRQIRLVAAACGLVACGWIALYIIPSLTLGYHLAPRNALFGLCGLVPLAYLGSIVTRDLYRLDRLAVRGLIHATTITILGAVLFLLATQFAVWGDPTGMLIALTLVVMLYRPVQHSVARLIPGRIILRAQHSALDRAIGELAQTLDVEQLIATLAEGIRQSFNYPAFAIYTGDIYGSNQLQLHTHERLVALPSTLPTGKLTELLCHSTPLIDSRSLYRRARTTTLTSSEQELLEHRGITLWGTIRHSQGHLLGLVLLGMRGDLDPYRPEDQNALQRLLHAASLAFAHSAAYAQQQASETVIRRLYQRLQTTQDTTARELAQELHDEIINVHVRLNIQALHKIAERNRNPKLHDEIALVLESLCAMSDDLRGICEALYPTGLNDVFGLGSVLREHIYKEQAHWHGRFHLEETGTPLPIAPHVQRAALRVMKEAITNAVKHAEAQTITVHLAYPSAKHAPIQLAISDDGQTAKVVTERNGHLGIRYMRESASAGGGTLSIEQTAGKGTTIVFEFSGQTNSTGNATQGDCDATV
jgi:signal transduction histidine kinase